MNCLNVDVEIVTGAPKVSIGGRSDLSFRISVVKRNICRCMKAVVKRISDFLFSMSVVNDAFSVAVGCCETKPKVELGIVCMTDLDTEMYLQVLDGFLVTIDGCYIKVKKR